MRSNVACTRGLGANYGVGVPDGERVGVSVIVAVGKTVGVADKFVVGAVDERK